MSLRKTYHLNLVFVLLLGFKLFAQLENANWALLGNKQLSTNTNPPTVGISALPGLPIIPTSISDPTGNLLLYTNGSTVYNGLHNVVANGTGLIGGQSILEKLPGSATLFYIFTTGVGGLYYSIVDISLAAGQGSVTTKNALITTYTTGPMSINGVRHCNGSDFWIVVSKNAGTYVQFDARHFSNTGINTTAVSSLYGPLTFTISPIIIGKISFSPRKNKMAFGAYTEFGLMDFDPSTGVASNSLSLVTNSVYGICWGTEFSSDGTKLYGTKNTTWGLYQWDLCAGDTAAVRNSMYQLVVPLINQKTPYGDACLGLDDKIYLAHAGYNISVINSPNLPGAACNPSFDVQAPPLINPALQNFIKITSFHLPPPPYTYTLGACQTVNFSQTAVSTGTTSYCNSVQGNFTGVLWNFGDPTTAASNSSTLTNPSHMFSAPGNYTVQLYRINSCSLSTDTSTQIISIPGPSISINISSSISCASLGTATVSVPSATTNYNYTWIPTFQTGSVAIGLSPGTYSVFLSTGSSTCDFVKIINLIPTGVYNFSISSSASVNCKGPNTATAQVLNVTGGSGGQTYLWTNGSQIYTTATVYSLSVGIWTVQINDILTHCQSTQTLFINPAPSNSLVMSSSSPSACLGGSITLSGLNLGGITGTTYTWSNGASTPSTTITQSVAGIYVYILSSETIYQCFTSNTISVQFIPSPVLTLENTSVCVNASTVITAGGNGTTYQWSAGIGLNATNSATALASPNSTQIYTVTSFANKCSSTGTLMLTVLPAPEITLVNTNEKICPEDSITLSATGGQVYYWKGPNNFERSGQTIRFKANYMRFAGQYTLYVTDQMGCTNNSVTSIEELPLPDGNIINFTHDACVPYCVNYSFSPSNNLATETTWTLNSKNYSGNTFSPCIATAGTYTLAGTLQNTSTGCKANLYYVMNLHPKPKADFDFSPQKPVEELDEVQFTNTSQGESLSRFHWYFNDNDGFKSTATNASYLYHFSGKYPVVLVVENKWACIDTVIKVVYVESDFIFYIPNAFTPNEDGRNDVFLPIVRSVKMFDFRIYDRWGEEVFHSLSPDIGWDGTLAGLPCKQDAYTWLIQISTTKGEVLKKTGTVTLLH